MKNLCVSDYFSNVKYQNLCATSQGIGAKRRSQQNIFLYQPISGIASCVGTAGMAPTLDTTLLISSKAYTPSTHTSSRDMYGLLTHHTPAEPYMDNVSEPSSNLYYSYRLHHQLPGNHDEVPLHLSNVAGYELA